MRPIGAPEAPPSRDPLPGVTRPPSPPLPFAEARRVVRETVGEVTPAAETVPLEAAAGRVLAEDVRADRDQPPFDRSMRDGFAVRSADLARLPAALAVAGEVRAGGAAFARALGPGECVEIMTGAPVPAGADAVVMVEHSRRLGPDRVELDRGAAAGENVVAAGSELRRGAAALARRHRLDHASVALLASVGLARVPVFVRPAVAIVTTGDELVEVGGAPGPTQIRNSNAWSLAAQVARAGGRPLRLPIARDEAGALRDLFARALAEAELLLVSGGISMGRYDLVEDVLVGLGGTVRFAGAAIRPGKPVAFGTARGKPFFALPGNPLSTMVTFELFARAAIELLGGADATPLRTFSARLAADYRQRALPLTVFVPAALAGELDDLVARPIPSQGSGDLAAMAQAQGLIVIAPGTTELPAGTLVPVLPK